MLNMGNMHTFEANNRPLGSQKELSSFIRNGKCVPA